MKNITAQKNQLREIYRQVRSNINEQDRALCNKKIAENLFSLDLYKKSDIIYSYVSAKGEVDTLKIISTAIKDGKKVAVPKCVKNTCLIEFYFIKSLKDLEKGAFNILEPNPNRCEKAMDFSQGICIVPALAFDKTGFRLGYGKGYYDRFLSGFSGTSIGICYNKCILDVCPHDYYDQQVNILITEGFVNII